MSPLRLNRVQLTSSRWRLPGSRGSGWLLFGLGGVGALACSADDPKGNDLIGSATVSAMLTASSGAPSSAASSNTAAPSASHPAMNTARPSAAIPSASIPSAGATSGTPSSRASASTAPSVSASSLSSSASSSTPGPGVSGSDGCGVATNQNEAAWVESQVATGTGMRPYSVWLPTDYDPMRVYPVILQLHGCGGGTNNVPVERHTGADAIVVRGTGSAGDCWDDKANGADVPYVEAIVEDVKGRFCTNVNAWFVAGYSSGSWLANRLGCIHSDIFRGLATVAGGLPGGGTCLEQPIAHMFVHDEDDPSNGIEGSEAARDRLLRLNGCDMPATSAPVEPSPCVSYAGCQSGYPVVWCQTTGEAHNRQDAFTGPEFWKFFQSLLTP